MAHELGHIAYGDTKALLLTNIGNGFFSLLISIANIFVKIFNHFISRKKDNDYIILAMKIIVGLINFVIWLFLSIGNLFLCMNSRSSEYLADGHAHRTGYGQHLIGALYIIDRISTEERGFRNRLKATHPPTSKRIARLEELE